MGILEHTYKKTKNIEEKFIHKRVLFIGSESYDSPTICIIEGLNKIGFEILVYKKENINSWFCNTIINNLDNIENNIDFIISNLHWGTRWSLYNNLNHKVPYILIDGDDSGVILEDIIKDINEPITFWLDAHHCGSDSGCSDKYISPVQHELEIIKNHPLADKHIIMIDDINYFSESNIEINKKRHPTKEPGYILKSELIDKLKSINEDINIEFLNIENGICVAYP